MKNHPGDFNTKVGYDIYLNPWWGLQTATSQGLIEELNTQLGTPDLWFQGLFHELLWGPRDLPREWRPGFHCNLSATNSKVWRNFWLPWRLQNTNEIEINKIPIGSNVLDTETRETDREFVIRYHEAIPATKRWLKACELNEFLID